MAKTLVIVESPAKAKTITHYLGKGHKVLASYGHVRDLVPKSGAVKPEHDFAMDYQLLDQAGKPMTAIRQALKQADTLLLATDPDREGEAIAWHLVEQLKEEKRTDSLTIQRVAFNQITKQAIKDAVANPRELNEHLIHAQQARRALDYLVGFHLSPLLWKKIRRGLSAGRVQSPALRLIVEREEEIKAFKPKEYWTIEAKLRHDNQDFVAKLVEWEDKKVTQFRYTEEAVVTPLIDTLKAAAQGHLEVQEVSKKPRKRNPSAPFITSTLQQEAARKLSLRPANTMRIAQQLYEGVQVDQEQVGLITYMRTDSVHLASEAVDAIRQYIQTHYDAKACPKSAPQYKTRSKNAQEAHEAIRPTDITRTPESLAKVLSAEQLKLYTLIWQRTLASQMSPAELAVTTVILGCGDTSARFKATGTMVVYPGFQQVYQEGQDDPGKEEDQGRRLPTLQVKDQPDILKLDGHQHFTEPPPRFSEASLIKALEAHGIGRPSTYASILSTLRQREYVELEKKRFTPTDLGSIVGHFLQQHFTRYVDYQFTAAFEDKLDQIAEGQQAWIPLLESFWHDFQKNIDTIDKQVSRQDVTHEVIEEACPECQSPLSIRLGKRGKFIGCTTYPTCRYTRNIDDEQAPVEEKVDRPCPKCESDLVIKTGRYGRFIGCSNYPDCKHIEPLEKPKDTGVTCPQCKKENLFERKSRRGKIFYSCKGYPKCKYALWDAPVDQACPKCQWPILTEKTTKRHGHQYICPQDDCDYTQSLDT